MSDWLRNAGRALVNGPLELLVGRTNRARLGRYITDRAYGENINDSGENGEHGITDAVKRGIGDKPAVVLDIGANVGNWTKYFVPGLKSNVTLFGFEPCRGTFNTLQQNLKQIVGATGGPRVEMLNIGLSDHEGTAQLFTGEDDAGTNTLHQREGTHVSYTGTVDVQLTRTDTFCREKGISELEFVKIDAEGHEVSILRGCGSLISERRIGCIQFEYNDTWIDARCFLQDAFALLVPAGYAMARIHRDGVEFFPAYSQKLERFQLSNFIAVRPDRRELFRALR